MEKDNDWRDVGLDGVTLVSLNCQHGSKAQILSQTTPFDHAFFPMMHNLS